MTEIAPGIEINPAKKSGKPVIAGTRVPVELILGKLANGMLYEDIISEYDLTKDQILAALQYAANILSEEEIRMVP